MWAGLRARDRSRRRARSACCTTSATRRSPTCSSGSTRSGSASIMGADAARDQAEYAAVTGPGAVPRVGRSADLRPPPGRVLPSPAAAPRPAHPVRPVGRRLDRLPARHHRRPVRRRPARLPHARRPPGRHRARQHRLAPPRGQPRAPPGVRTGGGSAWAPARISAFETMLVQRAQHYRWVIHHPAAVAADAALTRCAEGIFDLATAPPHTEACRRCRARRPQVGLPEPRLRRLGRAVRPTGRGMPRRRRLPRLAAGGPGAADRARAVGHARASAERARRLLRLHDVCDSFALEPVAAWRNYHEYLARAEQNPEAVAALVEQAPPAEDPVVPRQRRQPRRPPRSCSPSRPPGSTARWTSCSATTTTSGPGSSRPGCRHDPPRRRPG